MLTISKDSHFLSHSVNITSSFTVYNQSSLCLHPFIVTEALTKSDIYEAQVLITGDGASWRSSFICRILQPEKSNPLSLKIQTRGSEHKQANFSQGMKNKKKKRERERIKNSLQVFRWQLADWDWLTEFLPCCGITHPHQLSTPSLEYVHTGMLFLKSKGHSGFVHFFRHISIPVTEFWQQLPAIANPLPKGWFQGGKSVSC